MVAVIYKRNRLTKASPESKIQSARNKGRPSEKHKLRLDVNGSQGISSDERLSVRQYGNDSTFRKNLMNMQRDMNKLCNNNK